MSAAKSLAKKNEEVSALSPAAEAMAASLGARNVKRMEAGFFKSKIRRMETVVMSPGDLSAYDKDRFDRAGTGAVGEPWSATHFLCHEGLKDVFEQTFGKRDMLVEGKYRKASVFGFETPNNYVWCVIEPGARGTGWRMTSKAAKPKPDPVGSYEYWHFDKDAPEMAEIADLWENIMVACSVAHSPTMDSLAGRVRAVGHLKGAMEAAKEADEIESATGIAAPASKAKARKL